MLYEILNSAYEIGFQTLIDNCLIRLIEIITGREDLTQFINLKSSKYSIEETVSNLKLGDKILFHKDLKDELYDHKEKTRNIWRSFLDLIQFEHKFPCDGNEKKWKDILHQIQIEYKVPTDVTKPLLLLLNLPSGSRNSLLNSLVRMNADPQTLGNVFIHFTSKQAYKISDEEFYKTPIRSSIQNPNSNNAISIGNLIKNREFGEIFYYLPMNGYEYEFDYDYEKTIKKSTIKGKKIFTHPVIFDFFLNHYGYERILSNIHNYLSSMAHNRNDLLEIVFDYYSNLDPTNKLKVELKEKFLAFREGFLSGSVQNGNVKLTKFFNGLPKENSRQIFRCDEVLLFNNDSKDENAKF